MYTKSVPFYDALYSFKDYDATVVRLRQVIAETRPGAQSILDVACGTGKHLELLRSEFDVTGLDISADMLKIARRRCPGIAFHQSSMVDFDLGRRFDVVTLLFSSIAYVQTVANLDKTVATLARHLEPGGVLLLEPFFSPERFWTDTITANFVNEPELKIVWMYNSRREGALAILDINYLVGTPQSVDHFTERHELGLFTDVEYVAALANAGLAVRYDEQGLFGRGMYIGHAAT
jgi:ubiquinone/menaquinone biosynthesis C-methylase UbiE